MKPSNIVQLDGATGGRWRTKRGTIYQLCTEVLPLPGELRPMRELAPEAQIPAELEALVEQAVGVLPEDRRRGHANLRPGCDVVPEEPNPVFGRAQLDSRPGRGPLVARRHSRHLRHRPSRPAHAARRAGLSGPRARALRRGRRSSLRYDSDLLEVKPSTDILVHGSVVAPEERPAPSVPVTLRLGSVEKRLVVHGERVYRDGVMGLTTTSPRPFVQQPLRYESAFGGGDFRDPDAARWRFDERNPTGRGFAGSDGETPAHTIEYAAGRPEATGPAGFGPIDRGWLPRRKLAGTYDAAWVRERKPLLPRDYDPAFALAAPHDQRPSVPLVGGERMAVSNMTPEGMLVVELPRKRFALSSRFGATEHEHGTRLTTVLLETDERRLSLIWQSALRVRASDVDYLDETFIEEASP